MKGPCDRYTSRKDRRQKTPPTEQTHPEKTAQSGQAQAEVKQQLESMCANEPKEPQTTPFCVVRGRTHTHARAAAHRTVLCNSVPFLAEHQRVFTRGNAAPGGLPLKGVDP